jgi:histone H3
MSCVKQTAWKSTGKKTPCFHLATKGWHPGTVAAREIHKFQKTTNLLIRKAPFQHVVRKNALKFRKSNLQMQSTAVLAFQEAAEYFMVDVFNDTNLCMVHCKHITIKVKDMILACPIEGIGIARA